MSDPFPWPVSDDYYTHPSLWQRVRDKIAAFVGLPNLPKPKPVEPRVPQVAWCDEPGLNPCVMTGIAKEKTKEVLLVPMYIMVNGQLVETGPGPAPTVDHFDRDQFKSTILYHSRSQS